MSSDPHLKSELSRDLTLMHVTMMGVGMMIGAGVFLGIGTSIAHVGPGGVLLTFALNGVIAIFSAMSYAELSSAIPRAGGAYNFARVGFGRGTSFVAGWMEWFASSVAGSMYAITFAIYTIRYLQTLGLLQWVPFSTNVTVKLTALLVAVFFLWINYRGASETGKVGAFFTLGQTVFMLLIGAVGIVVALKNPERLQNFEPFLPNKWLPLLGTMGFTYVAFEGFEVIAQAGDETVDPKRNLPKAMLYSVYLVTVTYVLVAFASIVAVKASPDLVRTVAAPGGTLGETLVPWEWIAQFQERGFGEAVAQLMPFGNFLLTLAVIFASTSALNATVYSATRAAYALGRDRMLPSFFALISEKTKTPWSALVLTGVLLIVVAVFLPTLDVASSASIMFLFLFFMVNVCVIKIRRNMGDELNYGFLMPLFPLFPILAIICQCVLAVWLVHMSLIAWIIAPVWILSGWFLYKVYGITHVKPTEDEILVLEEKETFVEGDYKVMVPVVDPANALNLVRAAYRFCAAKKGGVRLLNMVEVPEQVPLSDADRYMMEGREAIVEARLYLEPSFPVSTTMRYCRAVPRGIVSAVRERNTDLLLMGWHGQPRSRMFTFGSTVDAVVERTPCDTIILKDYRFHQFKRILVPLAAELNGVFALETAGILGEKNAEIVALKVETDRPRPFDIQAFVKDNLEKTGLDPEQISTKIIRSSGIVKAILEEAEDYDLVILGYTRVPLLYRVGRRSIPEVIARRYDGPLAIVRASGGFRSWIRRWL